MTRLVVAYLIVALLALCATAVLVYSRRFVRYQRSLRRGDPGIKPVAKPFWLP